MVRRLISQLCPGIDFACVIFLGVSLLPAVNLPADEPPLSPLAEFFGFQPVEIFKLNERSANLLIGDVNQDGKLDIVSCDNSHSRIDFLQQRPEKTPPPTNPATSLNAFVSDPRFVHVKFPLDKSIAALALGDFNKDGRLDLAYLGNPDRLVIRFQSEQGTWKRQVSLRLPDVQPAQWILAAGDLNHDQQDDLALLGRKETFVFTKLSEKEISQPLKLMNTNDRPGLLQIQDLNGDGRADLSYVSNDDGDHGFCARFQTPQGELGPELQFQLTSPRAIQLANVDSQPGAEILSIHGSTGRIRIHQISHESAEPGEGIGRLVQFGLPGLTNREQDLAIGDVTGDSRNDLVSVDPESAELILYAQSETSGLAHGEKFPTLIGGTQIRLANLDQNPGDEILILSPREKTIGLSKSLGGKIGFPKSLPTTGEPLLMETISLAGSGEGVPPIETGLLYVSKLTGSSGYVLQGLKSQLQPDGELSWTPIPMGKEPEAKLPFGRAPERLLIHQAGETRILLFFFGSDKPPQIYELSPNLQLTHLPEDQLQGSSLLNTKSIQPARLDQPVLMTCQGNVARSLTFNPKQGWEVFAQYNATESGANLTAASALDLDGQPGQEIALIDQGTRKIRILRQEEGTYRPWKEVDLGSFTAFSSQTMDLNHDLKPDLVLAGKGRFGILYAGGEELQLKELAVYESQLEEIHFQDLTAGDLNHDGTSDLALIDTRSHRVEIVSYFPGVGIKPAISFKLFDSKHLVDEESNDQEPREASIADVTGDGLPDLLLLTHDRLLLYPQDTGE